MARIARLINAIEDQDHDRLPSSRSMPPILGACCRSECLESTSCAGVRRQGMMTSTWASPDPLLNRYGIRYLQVGGDTWNRCGPGWINLDANFDRGDGVVKLNTAFTDDTDRHNMKHIVSKSSRLPFVDNAFMMVYSEHMLEHLLPSEGGINFLREAYRVLAPGGIFRMATPDLDKYVCAFVEPDGGRSSGQSGRNQTSSLSLRRTSEGFLETHARRFEPMESRFLGQRPSRTTVLNNIFRNYGHQWIYNFDEVKLAAKAANAKIGDICRSNRVKFEGHVQVTGGLGLPRWARNAIRRANHPSNETQTCWLDQAVREDESMYINMYKPH